MPTPRPFAHSLTPPGMGGKDTLRRLRADIYQRSSLNPSNYRSELLELSDSDRSLGDSCLTEKADVGVLRCSPASI